MPLKKVFRSLFGNIMDSLDVFTNVFTLNDLNIFINCLIKMALALFKE